MECSGMNCGVDVRYEFSGGRKVRAFNTKFASRREISAQQRVHGHRNRVVSKRGATVT
jgi:hypothetical protein